MFLAKVWYFATSAGSVFVLPYFNLYFDNTLHFNKGQIGALSALRPWLSAGCQVVLCSMADWMGAHTAMLVLTFTVSVLLRCLLLAMPAHFLAVAALVLASDCIGSPVGAIVDATVVGACKNDGDYGKHRMWGSIGWGGLSVAAGWLVGKKGLGAGFGVYLALSLPCAFIAYKLRKEAAAAAADAAASNDTALAKAPSKTSPISKANSSKHHEPGSDGKSKNSGKSAAIACSADPDYQPEDLHARLLDRTPDSSCAGSEYSGSVCGDSRAETPDMAVYCRSRSGSPACRTSRPESPFSRFAQGEDLPENSSTEATPAPRTYSPSRLSVLGPAADEDTSLIKAVYAKEAANLTDEQMQDCAPTAPKQPAQLDRPSLNASTQLQSTYSRLIPADNTASNKDADAIPAVRLDEQESDDAPLLSTAKGKQPLSSDAPASGTVPADKPSEPSGVTVATLLVQPAVLVFLWRAVIIGLGLGVIGNFLFLHVEELGGSGTLMGLMLAFNILTEAPAFMFQTYILEKASVPFVFNASMLLLALRLAGYGFLPWLHSPWPVLILELMHGFTFATSWGAGIVHCKRLAPPHLNASMQGLFSSLYAGLGSGLGALLGGFLMQALGGQGLFFVCSVVVLGGWLLGTAVEVLLVRGAKQVA